MSLLQTEDSQARSNEDHTKPECNTRQFAKFYKDLKWSLLESHK